MKANQETPLTIGKLAKQASVGVETVRFYERKALINQPPKVNGFRHYADEDVKRIRLIKKLQELGFSLDEIKEFLGFDTKCSETQHLIKEKSLNKIEEINQKILDLETVKEALQTFHNACGCNHTPSKQCDLLECFDNQWVCCSTPE